MSLPESHRSRGRSPRKPGPEDSVFSTDIKTRCAKLDQELKCIDDICGVGGYRQPHLLFHGAPAKRPASDVGGVKHNDQHAHDIFPKECWREEVLTEDHLFPDGTRDHDRGEDARFDQN